MRIEFQPEAVADLAGIFRVMLLASRDPTIAKGFVQRIRNRCERIGNAPRGGRPRDDLEPGPRTVPFEHAAVIAYPVEPDFVRVTNVFYGGRDFEALFRRDDPDDEP